MKFEQGDFDKAGLFEVVAEGIRRQWSPVVRVEIETVRGHLDIFRVRGFDEQQSAGGQDPPGLVDEAQEVGKGEVLDQMEGADGSPGGGGETFKVGKKVSLIDFEAEFPASGDEAWVEVDAGGRDAVFP